MVKAIVDTTHGREQPLEQVYLVAFDRELEDAFKAAVEEHAENP